MLPISKTETNQDLKFNFSALDTGSYSILVVKDGIYNPTIDISQRSFSVHNENVEIDQVNLEHDIIINIGEPILKKNISSIDFINNYFVNYNFTDGSSQFGVLDTVIYNIGIIREFPKSGISFKNFRQPSTFNSTVVADITSSRVVSPVRTLYQPYSRMLMNPSCVAFCFISADEAPLTIRSSMAGVTRQIS